MKVLIIEKQKLEENIKKIKQQTYNQEVNDSEERIKIIAVVKCNGYGLGIVEYTKLLIENGIDFFAVSSVEEALQLRQAGIENNLEKVLNYINNYEGNIDKKGFFSLFSYGW